MYRRFPSILVTFVLVLSLATVSSLAQSGRGRQLRIQQTLRGESAAPVVAEVSEIPRIDAGLSKASPMEIRRNRGLIYNDAAANEKKDDGEYHMTKGDKRAGWILLGALVLITVATIASD